MHYPEKFDVVVIGGGHAGTEAALAAARIGASTLLLTQSIETLGQMSCNPAIGGIGKSHLVREIDALGGAMARAADLAGIQFRTLNSSKGPAVRAIRAQADRALYKAAIRRIVENQANLRILQDTVVDLDIAQDSVRAVVTQSGITIETRAVVLTTGTFLGGRIFIGRERYSGGRAGDKASNALAEKLRALPFRVGRLKTGTPPRIDGTTVDFERMEIQAGDEPRPTMSYLSTSDIHPRQVPCHITYTNACTHEIIRSGLIDSPMYSGVIEGVGPRYCPSIEDKVVRFAERDKHQVFVEPEGLETTELYPNGISTSLPFQSQIDAIHTIAGFENAHITRAGYAIEYDFFDPRDLKETLETKSISGLFFAGQINGTTGYEEAAAQGLVAGVNAARKVDNQKPWCLQRHEAYIGVLINDLITLGTNEPYRMFTSRAEFRLRLRQDNADLRLTRIGRKLGVVDDSRWNTFCNRESRVKEMRQTVAQAVISCNSERAARYQETTGQKIAHNTTMLDLLKRPGTTANTIIRMGWFDMEMLPFLEQVEVEAKYDGYIHRQDRDIERVREHKAIVLPLSLDYWGIDGLSNELQEKLSETRPETLAQASRIPGMTPAALSLLSVQAKKLGNPPHMHRTG